jgi:hypothetical protein
MSEQSASGQRMVDRKRFWISEIFLEKWWKKQSVVGIVE